jgi:hypothetical protein
MAKFTTVLAIVIMAELLLTFAGLFDTNGLACLVNVAQTGDFDSCSLTAQLLLLMNVTTIGVSIGLFIVTKSDLVLIGGFCIFLLEYVIPDFTKLLAQTINDVGLGFASLTIGLLGALAIWSIFEFWLNRG